MTGARDGRPLATGAVEVSALALASTAGAPLVRGVSLRASAGEALGLVGESGSGKSLTLRAILGILPDGVRLTAGLARAGGRIGMIFQDPLSALDPMATVGAQIAEAVRANDPGRPPASPRAAARREALSLLRSVGIPDPETRYGWFPHQLSGGQRQRVVIAIALATRPDVLLCDEPTTALDVTVQAQILALLDELRRRRGLTLVFVSHNLAVVAGLCDRIAVMRAGEIVERGTTHQIVSAPSHPYTRALIDAVLPVPGTEEGRA